MRNWHFCLAMLALAMIAAPGMAQPLAGKALIDALKGGGYVLVMRHANSPAAAPDKASADPENINLERQLDETGRQTATAMGEALAKLDIPLAPGLSSPTFRAVQTVTYAKLSAGFAEMLNEGAGGMAANAERARAEFLRAEAKKPPPPGQNLLIVTHAPNIASAFGRDGANVASGEMLVFRPGTNAGQLIARVKIEEWPGLAGGL